jgi:hypothetical protein
MTREPPEDFFSIYCRGITCDNVVELPISTIGEALKQNGCKTLQELCDKFVCDSCMAAFIIMVESSVILISSTITHSLP